MSQFDKNVGPVKRTGRKVGTGRTFRMELSREDGEGLAEYEVLFSPKTGRIPNAQCFAEEEAILKQACAEQSDRWVSLSVFVREAVLAMLEDEGYEIPDEMNFVESKKLIRPVGLLKGS